MILLLGHDLTPTQVEMRTPFNSMWEQEYLWENKIRLLKNVHYSHCFSTAKQIHSCDFGEVTHKISFQRRQKCYLYSFVHLSST